MKEISGKSFLTTTAIQEMLTYLNEEKRFLHIIGNNRNVFAKDKFDVGLVRGYEAEMKLKEDRYISKKPYRCFPPGKIETENQVVASKKNGFIEEYSSPFGASVTLTFRKEETRKSR